VYGASEKVFNESDAPRPTRPYETSKACVDLIAQAYADSYNLPVLIPRFSNIYGPGDLHFDRLIPKTIRSIYQGKNPIMWGGKARRAYLYIEDAIRAYDTLGRLRIEDIDNNRIYNVSSVSVYSVEEVMQKILYHMNSSLRIEKIENERQHEAMIQVMNSSKARKILQWEDTMSLDEGLIKTIAWYRKYFNKQYD
jgi:CDP-glucose 4,6-dehydratase